MENLNRVELIGRVGTANVKEVGDSRVCNFSVATDATYTRRNGETVIETTWHNVTAWEGNVIQNLDPISKGACVHVVGRLRAHRYSGSDGSERIFYYVLAEKVEVLAENR